MEAQTRTRALRVGDAAPRPEHPAAGNDRLARLARLVSREPPAIAPPGRAAVEVC